MEKRSQQARENKAGKVVDGVQSGCEEKGFQEEEIDSTSKRKTKRGGLRTSKSAAPRSVELAVSETPKKLRKQPSRIPKTRPLSTPTLHQVSFIPLR